MEYVRCNLCNADQTVLWGVKKGISIVRCVKCGLVYCNPRPTNEDLQAFYVRDYFNEGQYEENALRQRMYGIEIEEIRKNIAQTGAFLDIGCAVGKFLATLPASFEKWGTEFSAEAAEIGRKKFGLKIITGQARHAELPEKYFDIVQMRGVLEHSQDPYEDLVKIRRAMKDGGTLRISQLPNISSICAKLFGIYFNQVKPGEHLYYFSPKTVSAMLEKAGFKVTKLMFPYLGTPYASPLKDAVNIIPRMMKKKESPAFFGNMMILYAKKAD